MSFFHSIQQLVSPDPLQSIPAAVSAVTGAVDAVMGVAMGVPERVVGPIVTNTLNTATYGVSGLVIGRLDQQTRDEAMLRIKSQLLTARRAEAQLILAIRSYLGRRLHRV